MSFAPIVVPPHPSGEVAQGHVLGRYELLLPIAAGGMAMVWAARVKGTRGFQKIVAVKTMLSQLSEDEQFEQMFLDEASLASQIQHPNVVEISDLGEQDGVLYLAMEWIDGIALNQVMKTAKASGTLVPLPIAVRIVMNACAGLNAAHELRDSRGQLIGLVHRDVSPQNILVTYDGVSKVVDFGVAKATAIGGAATVAGQLKGKVSYMAPEQVRGEPIDRRVDIFAMGIVLYALTTGKHPFRRESEAATMYTIASEDEVVAPRRFVPDYPASLEAVLLKALAKNATDRYATASEFLRALDQSLPPEQRANTDEDIALYMTRLFGNRREESRAALAQALALADLHVMPRGDETSSPPRPHGSLSEVGLTKSALTVESKFATIAPRATVAERRKRVLLLGLVAAALLASAGLWATEHFRPARRPRTSGSVLVTTPTLQRLPPPAPPGSAVEPKSGTVASSSPAPSPAPMQPAAARVTPGPVNLPFTPSPKLVKSAAPKWREDPGF